jgi:hypothetical protein
MKILSKAVFPKECISYPNTLGLFIAEQRLGYVKYIFDTDFLHLVRYALSTDCISELNEQQLDLFMTWVNYNTALMNDESYYLRDDPVLSLDKELIKITECIPDPGEIICGNAELHTYTACAT